MEKKNILIIDTDNYIKSILSYIFKQKGVYTVFSSSLTALKSTSKTLNFCDFEMAVINYSTIINNSKEIELLKICEDKTPTVMMLGKKSLSIMVETNFSPYSIIFKPIDLEEIIFIYDEIK